MKKQFRPLLMSLTLLLGSAQVYADRYGSTEYDYTFGTVMEYSSDDKIEIYNTGMSLNVKDDNGLGGNFRGAVDGKLDEINSKDFELGKFVKELKVNYEIDTENTVVLLSVGKMPTGAKTDRDNPRLVGGVMGMRMSIQPKKIPLIQKWLDANDLKITRIDITRYDADSGDRLDVNDLGEVDMTSYAVYLSKGRNLHTFFIQKRPDRDNIHGTTSTTIGAAYMMEGKYKPQFFGMTHQSKSSYMDLDLLVLSAGVEIIPEVKTNFTYSRAFESVTETKKDIFDVGFSKVLVEEKSKKFKLQGTIGAKAQRGDTKDNIIYVRIEAKY